MESPRHWYSILGELVVKTLEGILTARLPKPVLRRYLSGDRNEILQTIVIDTANIRNKDIQCSLDCNWTLSVCVFAAQQQLVEKWEFEYVVMERSKREDLYRQASTSLRAVLCLALVLPAYYKHREGWKLTYALDTEGDWGTQQRFKRRLKMFETVAGTLYLEVQYAAKIELLSPSKLLRGSSLKNLESHPLSQWGFTTLSESEDSEDEPLPYTPIEPPCQCSISQPVKALIELQNRQMGHLSLSSSPSNRVSLGYAVSRADPVVERAEKCLPLLSSLVPERPLKEAYFELLAVKAQLERSS